ncbi:uncharacterized protein LOC116430768 [Nomia melanderi]|uniref:uncharacterized protein LOC116430768 n=1 Tax=Nomia melanderi TaxID=2448451 RepID=UPI0013040F0F|nr:uncharacterized protein LOC116430768 [Nomia melanderi]
MLVSRSYVLLSVLAVVFGAPRRSTRSTVPTWHLPCGEIIETEPSVFENLNEEVETSLQSLKLQHELTMNDYLNRDYDFLYERVRIGVENHHYIPNWVPDEKDVHIINDLVNATPQEVSLSLIAERLPKMHMDLQKFAVAFEELVDDETNSKIHNALKGTQSYLMMLLCEVESHIVNLPFLRVPSRVHRSIMKISEREPVDDTRRLVRDWGVVRKYRDYLHIWRRVFDY